MPSIFEPQDLPVTKNGSVNVTTLANQAMLGTDALQVQKILLQPGAESATHPAAKEERFLYVIHGKGQAYVGEQALPLNDESVLWLEPGDAFSIEAGADGLEVLLCQATAHE